MGAGSGRDGYRQTHIATATTTEVTGSATKGGRLIRVIINTTAAGTITISDANGTVAIIAASAATGSYEYDVKCAGRIRVITGAASDITVVWD
jgi:hypothetical protein